MDECQAVTKEEAHQALDEIEAAMAASELDEMVFLVAMQLILEAAREKGIEIESPLDVQH